MHGLNLPLLPVSTFDRVFTWRRTEYVVVFQGRTPVMPPVITQWCLLIPHHPEKGLVKYLLEKRYFGWQKSYAANPLEGGEEFILLRWAVDVISAA
jgi:hypothetical protein